MDRLTDAIQFPILPLLITWLRSKNQSFEKNAITDVSFYLAMLCEVPKSYGYVKTDFGLRLCGVKQTAPNSS